MQSPNWLSLAIGVAGMYVQKIIVHYKLPSGCEETKLFEEFKMAYCRATRIILVE